MNNKKQNLLNAFTSAYWAIDRDWMETATKVLFDSERFDIPSRNEAESALFQTGEKLDGSRYTYIQGKTGVIDIYGAITPRANFFSDWSGGVSCELLKNDIERASNNPNVENIILSIHSPGGEVTGVQEVAEAIYKASQDKKIIAYIAGMGCSAAYWIASSAGTIIVNPTAVVGSIGVMSVYLDDSKAMEDAGYKEIEIISSQSPDKNLKPTTKKGRDSVQLRVNALADVFYETVARNRGVEKEFALENFGKGDVFIGQEAVDAGMAESVGFLTDVFAMLSNEKKTFGASAAYSGSQQFTSREDVQRFNLSGGFGSPATIKAFEDTAIRRTIENSLLNNSNPNKDEVTMSKENTETVSLVEFEKLKAENQQLETEKLELAERVGAAEKVAEKEKRTLLEKEMADLTKDFYDKDKAAEFALSIVDTFGRDSKEFSFFVTNQTALNEQINEGLLLEELGSDAAKSGKSAIEEIEEKTKALMEIKTISKADAMTEVANANPELYERYSAERKVEAK